MKKPESIFSTRRWEAAFSGTRAWKKLGESLFIILLLIFSCWLMFHTFSYDGQKKEMRIAFKLWSDFGAHIPLIRSFSMGGNWDRLINLQPIEYPIYPGEPIRYHFLFDMVVGLLEKAGLRIDWALNIPSIIGFFTLMAGVYILAKKLFQSKTVAILSVVFFLFNGSLAFVEFFKTHAIADIMHAKNFPGFAPWGPGEITAFWNLNIYTNQRHLAGAFALVLFFILTCLYIEHLPFKKQISRAIGWAVLIGILPYYHQPALLIFAIFMFWYFILFPWLRKFLFIAGMWATCLVLPQLLFAESGGSGIQWYPGYIFHNELAREPLVPKLLHMLSFWWQNLGLHLILMPVGFFLAPKTAKRIIAPIILLFIIAYLFKFSVEATANHKFFNFVMILGQMLSAHTLVWLFHRIRIRLLAYSLISVFLILLTLSGVIDFFVVKNDTIGSLKDIQADTRASWIAQNTPADAIFLNSNYLYHPASVAGRAIYLGWPYFAWSAGYPENRMPIMDAMYETRDPAVRCDLLKKRNISYITVENVENDVNLPRINLKEFLDTYTPIFLSSDKKYAIFSVSTICNE